MSAPARKGYYCPQCGGPVDAEDSLCLNCNAQKRGAWPVDPYVGRTMGRKYRIDRRMGASASGTVFEAMQMHQDTELGKVIIKMLPKQATTDPAIAKRFVDEARAARTLTNPHVVRVFDLDFEAGHVPYLVQEYVEGERLDEIIMQEGRLDPARALTVAIQIAEGMEEAHEKHILHRNLKPSNVVVRAKQNRDFVKIIGFGMYQGGAATTGATKRDAGLYLAPEQAAGREADERTDIHALGLILFEMLSGRTHSPGGPSLTGLLPDADTSLTDLVEMLLEPDPADRPGDMHRVLGLLAQGAQELGLNLDITGRFTLPPRAGETEKEPASLPPELPRRAGPAGGRAGRGRLHPGIVALAVVAGLVLVAAVVLGATRACRGLPGPGPGTPPAEVPAVAPAADGEAGPDAGAASPEPSPPPDAGPQEGPATDPAPDAPRKKTGSGKKHKTPWTKI